MSMSQTAQRIPPQLVLKSQNLKDIHKLTVSLPSLISKYSSF